MVKEGCHCDPAKAGEAISILGGFCNGFRETVLRLHHDE
jgi:hypothetical protein